MLICLERETAAPAEGQKGEDLKEAAWPVAGQEREIQEWQQKQNYLVSISERPLR